MTSYADHSDSIATKLKLFEELYRAGKIDLAMSLAESIKETLTFERQLQAPPPADIKADQFLRMEQLPPALAQWGKGWSFCKTVTVHETVGIARSREPVELNVAVLREQCRDPYREIRVARWDASEHRLREIPSQVHSLKREGNEYHFALLFFAEAAAHDSAQYLILFGNPNAELPEYTRDLKVTGEGWALEIANEHYVAKLSRQSGEVERLVFTRNHGNELFAGGKGHGEPPAIDWGCDYVDAANFQKLRMRNGTKPPNYEVIRGPLCVQIRRWGFPFSPMHPLFTPSRMHMDVTYTFYSGLPYFLKTGRVDMLQDFPISAMRDDEWVFSGYSFTHPVWLDEARKLREGDVPAADNDKIWGIGFYNETSRDAFFAHRLIHEAQGWEAKHNGVPQMNYAHHGQLWSRYPANGVDVMKKGWSVKQKNAYSVEMWPREKPREHVEQVHHELTHPLQLKFNDPISVGMPPVGKQMLARTGETAETAGLKAAIWKTLREVKDEQLYSVDANIVDMGYVYDVRVRDGVVRVVLTMPHRGRPVFDFFIFQGGGRVEEGIRERLLKLKGVRDVWVETTWEPPWSIARLTDKGREAMKLVK
ncbi:MAG: iron-sulfur cluster assembly protein [Planctomycetales bacterium]